MPAIPQRHLGVRAVGEVRHVAVRRPSINAGHAGHAVKMTGELKGNTITVSKIEM